MSKQVELYTVLPHRIGIRVKEMKSLLLPVFGIATALKLLLIPAYHSTDFEVHRNWLAITYSLPIDRWYVDATSEWTLDYPPFFAYFEWVLAQIAHYVDPQMLVVDNLNYASIRTKYFQRLSVIATDLVLLLGVWRCLRNLPIHKNVQRLITGEVLLLLNVGLLFIDHIHFQYNGFLFGILLLSISFLLEDKFLLSAFLFTALLNFKHIFLYMAPAFGVYLLKFYCFSAKNPLLSILKLIAIGIGTTMISFGPFYNQLPQVFSRLFPFKRGLTHAYWAPNFWALYNTADKIFGFIFRIQPNAAEAGAGGVATSTSGLVQDVKHVFLPTVTPSMTFLLTALFMLPQLIKLFHFTPRSESKLSFLRTLVLCSCCAFLFGWHVHEKAILMCLIPLCLLCLASPVDAKWAFILSVIGYFSLFPLLFDIDLLMVRYSLYMAYICMMYSQIKRMHNASPSIHWLESIYIYGFAMIPLYEHLISPIMNLNEKLPFMPLLLTSFYCGIGVLYFFCRYYLYALSIGESKETSKTGKTKSKTKRKTKEKTK